MTHTPKGVKVWNDQRIGKYPFHRKPPKQIFRPGNAINAEPSQTWIDPSCPFSPFVANSGIPLSKQDKIKDNLRAESKARLVLANYKRPLPLEDDFLEPEALCTRRRHFKVTRRNPFVREYLTRDPSMAPPIVLGAQPSSKERGSIYISYILMNA